MAAEEHDIHARVSTGASSSTGALAAHLQRACGHVMLDERVIAQGYRFYPELSDEIPAFFNKRMSTGTKQLAITLQYGIDPDGGDDVWADCTTHAQARTLVEAEDNHASLWLASVTLDVRLYDLQAISDPIFIARHPNEFRVIAEELVALGVLQTHACALCA